MRKFNRKTHPEDRLAPVLARICRLSLANPESVPILVDGLSLSHADFNALLAHPLDYHHPHPRLSKYYSIDFIHSGEDAHGLLLCPTAVHPYQPRGQQRSNLNAILAFWPTVTYQNWWVDFQVQQKAYDGHKGAKVHVGFWRLWASIEQEVLRLLKRHRARFGQLICTGMSLGGALAEFAAVSAGGEIPTSVYTFGAPRAGDHKWCRLVQKATQGGYCCHYVNHGDPIPTMPLGSWYEHPGQLIHAPDEEWDASNKSILAHKRYFGEEFWGGTWEAYAAEWRRALGL